MKKYSFLILVISISLAAYVFPDFLFGTNVAEAATINVVENVAAGNDDNCNQGAGTGYLRYDIIPGGIRLCKKITTVEYTPGTTQATVVDDVKTVAYGYEALFEMGMQIIYPNTMGDMVRRQNNINIMQTVCSTLGSGWTPYSLDFPAFDSSSGNIRCKHSTTISYTPGTINQKVLTSVGLFPSGNTGDSGCKTNLEDLGFHGVSDGTSWGWSGANVIFCKVNKTLSPGPLEVACLKGQTLVKGTCRTETPSPTPCDMPPIGATFTAPYTLNYSLQSGNYSGFVKKYFGVLPEIIKWAEYITGGNYSISWSPADFSNQGLMSMQLTGTNSAGCEWNFTVGGGGTSSGSTGGGGSSTCQVPPMNSTYETLSKLVMILPEGQYSGTNPLEGNWKGKIQNNWSGYAGFYYSKGVPAGRYTGVRDDGVCPWDFTVKTGSYTPSSPTSCNVPAIGAVLSPAPYDLTMSIPAGSYSGTNPIQGKWAGYIDANWSGYADFTYTRPVSAGRYTGVRDDGVCPWDFTVKNGGGSTSGGTSGSTSGGTSGSTSGGSTSGGTSGGTSGSTSGGGVCLHYTSVSWVACTGYDTTTGQGGTQTGTVSSYTNNTCPSSQMPSLTRSCSMPANFNLLLDPPEQGILGNTYSTFVTFIGGEQQPKHSSPVRIAISPTFPNHPDLTNVTFKVTGVAPDGSAWPSSAYTFTPNPLPELKFAQGTSFIVNVPYTNSGVYTLMVEASGGGIVKQAKVYLNVSVVNPTFIEI